MQFLDEGNVAGQTLLRLVARGNAIIAELLRLSAHVPPEFKVIERKYQPLVFDFNYIGKSDAYEDRIQSSAQLLELDSEFKENHLDILKRFYQLFESIYKYVVDFKRYLDDVESGNFIQLNLEQILMDHDGKQLVAEALYLYGVMLIILDARIDGIVRERILISYLRYTGQNELTNIDEVCKLCGRTGFSPGKPNPPNYPEAYFARFPLSPKVISMIIGRLRSDDIYSLITAYPLPEHRSVALATQAQMLYVILYFAPDILKNESAIMREIVDKHFPDNWIIVYYLGFVVDLSYAWEPYKAAKMALDNTISPENLNRQKARHWNQVPKLLKVLKEYLTEGILREQYILEKKSRLLNHLRECNVTLRWLMLHTRASRSKQMREILGKGIDQEKVLLLLINTAQFEFVLKNSFQNFLDKKQEKWEECRKESGERIQEMSKVFSGEAISLIRVKKNERLQKWFEEISKQIFALDYNDEKIAGRKIQQLIQALEEVEQFHQIEENVQVKQFLEETRKYLKQMVRIANLTDEALVIFGIVTDIAYAWEIINTYVSLMQARIKRDPGSVIKFRSTFLKLASILQIPLIRIDEANSPDLVSVSQYYSGELVKFVRLVLEVVPKSMFEILAKIINIQTKNLKEIPSKVDINKLREEYAQLSDRQRLAQHTYAVSVFTRGILAMETTLVGVVQIDPKQLLEDGIRKELVKKIASSLHSTFSFTGKNEHRIEVFEAKLRNLTSLLDGFRRSFTYIQDYVSIYGLKIWQEEFSRIVNYNVEQECNAFLKKKVYDWQSTYQSEAIPIPRYKPLGDGSINFIGRLARELLLHTSFQLTTYLDQMSGWYDKNGRELVGVKTFVSLIKSIGVFGITGLDRLLSFMMVRDLTDFVSKLRSMLKGGQLGKIVRSLSQRLNPTKSPAKGGAAMYAQVIKESQKIFSALAEPIANIGQKQLIRRQLSKILNFSCKLDSNMLFYALTTFNNALMSDIRAHYRNPETKPYPSEENPLLSELAKYLDSTGINDPFSKIYITTDPVDELPLLIFLLVLSQLSRFNYNRHLSVLMPRSNKYWMDATSLEIGVITLLKQFHSINTQKFLAFSGQYIRTCIEEHLKGKKSDRYTEYPPDVTRLLLFLEDFCKYGRIPRRNVEAYLPAYVFDQFSHATGK